MLTILLGCGSHGTKSSAQQGTGGMGANNDGSVGVDADSGGNDGGLNSENLAFSTTELVFHSDPADPLIAVGPANDGTAFEVSGAKSPVGDTLALASVTRVVGTDRSTVIYDVSGRPAAVVASDGSLATIDYSGTSPVLTLATRSGTSTVNLNIGSSVPRVQAPMDGGTAAQLFADSSSGTQTLRASFALKRMSGPVTDGIVTVDWSTALGLGHSHHTVAPIIAPGVFQASLPIVSWITDDGDISRTCASYSDQVKGTCDAAGFKDPVTGQSLLTAMSTACLALAEVPPAAALCETAAATIGVVCNINTLCAAYTKAVKFAQTVDLSSLAFQAAYTRGTCAPQLLVDTTVTPPYPPIYQVNADVACNGNGGDGGASGGMGGGTGGVGGSAGSGGFGGNSGSGGSGGFGECPNGMSYSVTNGCIGMTFTGSSVADVASQELAANNSVGGGGCAPSGCNGANLISVDEQSATYTVQSQCTGATYVTQVAAKCNGNADAAVPPDVGVIDCGTVSGCSPWQGTWVSTPSCASYTITFTADCDGTAAYDDTCGTHGAHGTGSVSTSGSAVVSGAGTGCSGESFTQIIKWTLIDCKTMRVTGEDIVNGATQDWGSCTFNR